VLIDQIDNGVDYAAAGKNPYSPEQIVNIAYNLVFQISLFTDKCKKNQKNPAKPKDLDKV